MHRRDFLKGIMATAALVSPMAAVAKLIEEPPRLEKAARRTHG